MATVLHECEPVESYEPTWQDWEDYRRHLEREEELERCDRDAVQEQIRREAFNNARSAACVVRGAAAALGAYGLDAIARRLVAASDDVLACVSKYA